ncbi:hypothetical protein GCM10025868_43700 [Angustibacter aerolatus]|uniref:PASTA domain-containing protein n=1 Tax=Angustibacter aerolatus TaxID=1162965 RepID=A0ABQ6JPD5_9ACTN|nr:hypothetical protein GCM10025868_43700 [Angustibacter aerolatus]
MALVAVLLLAALLGVGGWYLGAGPGAYAVVPPLAGTSQDAATGALRAAGLSSDVATAFSETVPAGEVVEADPAPGQRVRKRTAVQADRLAGQGALRGAHGHRRQRAGGR